MKNNDVPKKSFFDIVLENSHRTPKAEENKVQTPKPNPTFLLGLVAGLFFFSFFLYLGLDVLTHKVSTFPSFTYFDTIKMYIGFWVLINLIKRK